MSSVHVKQEGDRVIVEIAGDWAVTTYTLELMGRERSSLRVTGDRRRLENEGSTSGDAALVIVPESARSVVLALI